MVPLGERARLGALVDSAVQASVTLGAVVRPSFGPNGLDVLLERSDGHVSCCNCGRQILASLSLTHPVAGVIVKSVANYHKIFGDGSKKMVLVVKGAMEELGTSMMEQTEASRAMAWLNHTVLPYIMTQLRQNELICRSVTDSESFRDTLMTVASTSYRHCYGRTVSRKFDEILSVIFHPLDSIELLKKHVEFTRNYMSTLVVSLPCHSLSHSRAIPGFLLDSDTIHPTMRSTVVDDSNGTRSLHTVLLLEWSTISEDDQQLPQISLDQLSELDGVIDSFSRQLQNIGNFLQTKNIELLLCCGKVPSVARTVLREAGIISVEMVPEDMLRVLAECCGTHPLQNVHDIIRDSSSTIPLILSHVDVHIKQYICLQIPSHMGISPVSVLLCGPTVGFCRQLQQQLSNTLLVVNRACQDNQLITLVGGGAWEMAVIRQLETYKLTHKIMRHSPKWTAIGALQKGLLAVPHSLLTSSFPPSSPSHPALLSLHTTTSITTPDSPYMRVDCINGTLVEMKKEMEEQCSVLESFSSQYPCTLYHYTHM